MPIDPAFLALGDEQYVSLTTFRKSGVPVETTVWIAREGDALVVTTGAAAGKVKRVRADSRVELRPSGRMGEIIEGASTVAGRATVIDETEAQNRSRGFIAQKYGEAFDRIMSAERSGQVPKRDRVIISITPA